MLYGQKEKRALSPRQKQRDDSTKTGAGDRKPPCLSGFSGDLPE